MSLITFLGNFQVDYTSETHHKRSLESLGHTVLALQEGQVPSKAVYDLARESDMFVWVHTHGWATPKSEGFGDMASVLRMLKDVDIPTVTYHLDLWFGLDRQKDLESNPFYKHIDHFFTVDKLMADWFNENTLVKGHFLPAGVYDKECIALDPKPVDYEVVFSGSRGYHKEWPYRPRLVDFLRNTYGSKFLHVGRDGDTGIVRGLALNQIYSNASIVVGDSLNIGFNYPYYSSDRYWESMGRFGMLVYPEIYGHAPSYQNGVDVVYYKHGDLGDLKGKIDYYLENEDEREKIRRSGHERTKREGTYINRWQTILQEVLGG